MFSVCRCKFVSTAALEEFMATNLTFAVLPDAVVTTACNFQGQTGQCKNVSLCATTTVVGFVPARPRFAAASTLLPHPLSQAAPRKGEQASARMSPHAQLPLSPACVLVSNRKPCNSSPSDYFLAVCFPSRSGPTNIKCCLAPAPPAPSPSGSGTWTVAFPPRQPGALTGVQLNEAEFLTEC